MKGISEFFVLFLKLSCESEIYFKLKMNKYIKDFGFRFGAARNKGDGEWTEAKPGEHEDPPKGSVDRVAMAQQRRNGTGPSTGADLSQKLRLEFSAVWMYMDAGWGIVL